ncbi:MAG TPA: hypothetical protein V6C97_27310 [Oculatellaceae cyanobacterium]
MAYRVVMNSQYYVPFRSGRNAMLVNEAEKASPANIYGSEMTYLAEKLMLDLPGFDWTIEVDLMGRHRITVHFKGISVSIDE